MNTRKNKGPRTEPWGTPANTTSQIECTLNKVKDQVMRLCFFLFPVTCTFFHVYYGFFLANKNIDVSLSQFLW